MKTPDLYMLLHNRFSRKKIATQTSINIITQFRDVPQPGNLIRCIPSFPFGCNL
jgi:hypothetical protein